MNVETKFEVKAYGADGEVYEMEFTLPGAIDADGWKAAKGNFEKLLGMVNFGTSDIQSPKVDSDANDDKVVVEIANA